MKPINIVHIYPKEMNIYGDNGNVLVLQKRLEWRGIPVRTIHIGVGDKLPADTHIIIGGGGQDAGQSVIADDLQKKSDDLHNLAKAGVPMLMICGMYQMFGHYFKTQTDEKIPGIGLLDVYTVAKEGRLIGNIFTKTNWGKLVGYENHSGRTYIGANAQKFGIAKKSQGNNGIDETEGAFQYNVFGSYMHGPMLAKAPVFADYLIGLAIKNSGQPIVLKPLDDQLELSAARIAKKRPR
jgi:CobQ-like glutamine amidotransferase family enzyme